MSSEFLLTAACCIWPPSDKRNNAISQASARGIDWQRMSRIVARHRVAGLVHDGLRRAQIALPSDFASALGRDAQTILRTNLLTAAESVRLHRAMSEAGVSAIFFKGSTLAQLAYGELGIRHSKDIDLIVEPTSMTKASKLLETAGYVRFDPKPTLSQAGLRTYASLRKDYAYLHSDKQTELELHWRLFDNRVLMPMHASVTPIRTVRIGAAAIPTFLEEDLFAYLCLHGSLTGWFRLKWLADIGALLAQAGPDKIQSLFRASQERGAGRAAGQAILLCHHLLGTTIPETLHSGLVSNPSVNALERTAIWALAPGSEEKEPSNLFLGGVRVNFSHFRLLSDLRYWIAELKCCSIAPDDLALCPLPKVLHFLYPLLRLPLWLWRHFSRSAP